MSLAELQSVLGAWGFAPGEARIERATSGLIQETWFVDAPGRERLVVQRMHPIFAEPVLEDLEAVTEHVAARGLPTPLLVRARSGARGVRDAEGFEDLALVGIDRAVAAHRHRQQ